MNRRGTSVLSLLIGALIFIGGSSLVVMSITALTRTNEALRHAIAMEQSIALIMKPTVTHDNSVGAVPCHQLNLMGIKEAPLLPTPLPVSAYPIVLKSLDSVGYKDRTSNTVGNVILSVGTKPGNAQSIELIQMQPRLSNQPAYIDAILRIKAAKINAEAGERIYNIPFTFRVDPVTSAIVACENRVMQRSWEEMCELLNKTWDRGNWKCRA